MKPFFTRFIEFPSLTRKTCRNLISGAAFSLLGISANAQCIPSYGNGCSSNDDINSFTLTGQGASSISDLNTGCGPGNGYEDQTALFTAVDLMQGGTYSGTVTTNFGSSEFFVIWIDFNNDNIFDPSEIVTPMVGPFGSGSPANYSMTLPITAATGTHRMRVRLAFAVNGNTIDPCNFYSFGETHDYLANVLPAPPCSGIPAITGVTPAGPISSCAGASQTLNMTIPIAGGYSFQWQVSTNGGTSYTDIPGATNTSYGFTVTGAALYQVIATCTNGGGADTSTPVSVSATPPTYGPVPYFQDFESWTNYCDNHDIPSDATGTHWTNNPATGDNSWRRDDEGWTANWSFQWGAYFPTSISGLHSARFNTAAAVQGTPGSLDLYLDCSTQTGNKQLFFYLINQPFNLGDSLTVSLSTDGGLNFNQVAGWDTAMVWARKSAPIASNSPNTILRFQAKSYNFDFSDIGIDSVYVAPPCVGQPVVGTLNPGGTITGCPGLSYTLEALGTTMAGNINYQWQESIDFGATWNNVSIGGTGMTYTTPTLYDTVYYRLIITCAGSGLTDMTAPVMFNISAPIYASLPYSQGFENWVSYCSTQDVPSFSWINNPNMTDLSWRRDDEGNTAGWNSPGSGGYSPVSMEGQHSARFHTWNANWQGTGDLDLFVDCSDPGQKELQFYQINPSGFDELQIFMSTDGGVNFSQLNSWTTASTWTLRNVAINSTSPTTVIRFRGISDFSDDMGIDNAMVLLPCTGNPVAGAVDTITPCSGIDFNLSLVGATLAAGLSYQWEESPDGVNWTPVAGATTAVLTYNITVATWFRCTVTCTASGLSDVSTPTLLNLATFYYCYCGSVAQASWDLDIGNVTVETFPGATQVLNNGNASPLTFNPNAINQYTNYTNLPPTDLYKEQAYNMIITQINNDNFWNGGFVAAYIDYDHNGQFDLSEQVLLGSPGGTAQQYADSFIIPANAEVGITGMRIVMSDGPWTFPAPCSSPFTGETEDYLVNINYPPCDGPVNVGVATISDTLVCPGTQVTLIDTTHEYKMSGIIWGWQSSTDGVNWTDIAGTQGEDTVQLIAGSVNTQYRMKMLCALTSDETASNVLNLTIKLPYYCYCASFADGGNSDVSDVGAFSIGNYITNSGGPHLLNLTAINAYTVYPSPAIIYADSNYSVSAYHVIKDPNHQDAKVTLFIDFNNNFIYDIPEERVWTGFTSATNVYINSTVNIPSNAVQETLTGMRLIINSDVGPNIPSDEACGPYTSGETEDYVVMIRPKSAMGVPGVGGFKDVALFPNPTTGKTSITLRSAVEIRNLSIKVTNVAGQLILRKDFGQAGTQFSTELDLSNSARGVYFVEISDGKERLTRKLIVK
jgi:hypothetical protein